MRLSFHARQNISLESLELQINAKTSKLTEKIVDGELESEKKNIRLVKILQIPDFRFGNRIINIKSRVIT